MGHFLKFSGLALFLALLVGISSYWLDRAIANQVTISPPLETTTFIPVTDPKKVTDVDLVIAIDNSGSMCCKPGTDKQNLRIRAAELVITSLAADIFPRQTSIGILSFGDRSTVLAPLTPLEQTNARQMLIAKAQETGSSNTTNITDALDGAYYQLFESGNHNPSNTPALILLTDGVPTSGGTNVSNIQERIDKLSANGTRIFIILLRGAETEDLAVWSDEWYKMSTTHSNMKYYEAKQASDLEPIYNDIRNWLDTIGKSSGRVEYDPNLSDEKIVFPPNLQKAVLIVRKPIPEVKIGLLTPDGNSGENLNFQTQTNQSSGDLNGFFKVYTLKQPAAGDWHLDVSPSGPVSYILDFQSIYSAQLFSPTGEDFLNLSDVTTIYADVVDTNSKSAGGDFDLSATLLWNIAPSQNPLGQETIDLGQFVYHPEIGKYVLNVSPDILPGPGDYEIEVKGSRKDGSIVNLTRYQVKAISMPGDAKLSIPSSIECGNPKPEILDYRFLCSAEIPVKLVLSRPEELSQNQLSAVIQPINASPVQIPEKILTAVATAGEFEADYGPLPYPGEYSISAKLNGTSRDGNPIVRSASSITKLVLPAWVYDLKRRLIMAAVLLLVMASWKPVIVWILSWVFFLFRLVPKGKYNSVSTQAMSDDFRLPNRSISKVARENRQLFGARIGVGEPIPIRYPPPVKQATRPRGWVEKLQNTWLFKWFFDESERPYWSVRVIPFVGIVLCDDENETPITDHPITTVSIGDYTVSFSAGEKPDVFDWIARLFRK